MIVLVLGVACKLSLLAVILIVSLSLDVLKPFMSSSHSLRELGFYYLRSGSLVLNSWLPISKDGFLLLPPTLLKKGVCMEFIFP